MIDNVQWVHEYQPRFTPRYIAQSCSLDDNTILYLRPRGAEVGKPDVDITLSDKEFEKQLENDESKLPGQELWCKTLDGVEYKIGYVPVVISDLKILRTSSSKALLAFSAAVYPEDPTLDSVEKLDDKYEKELNGAEVQVFDKLLVRYLAWMKAG